MNVGIDSMILVYAGIVPSKPGTAPDEELRVRSKLLMYLLAEKEDTVFLPMIAVVELLVPVPPTQRGLLASVLSERFVCPAFDLPAAALSASPWAQHKQLPQDQRYENRIVLRADVMIVASARMAGATDFYSNDRNCRTLVEMSGMKPHELPIGDSLENQWIIEDIRKGEDF